MGNLYRVQFPEEVKAMRSRHQDDLVEAKDSGPASTISHVVIGTFSQVSTNGRVYVQSTHSSIEAAQASLKKLSKQTTGQFNDPSYTNLQICGVVRDEKTEDLVKRAASVDASASMLEHYIKHDNHEQAAKALVATIEKAQALLAKLQAQDIEPGTFMVEVAGQKIICHED